VLVLGESGSGKDATARFIHDRSLRRERPFVKIDCAALPEDLLESELFGYEKGAFTGATDSKPGRFEAADGGTLVLDEIGSLISSSQAKLLRVIEERSFERLGGKQPIKIDVRIIALANIDIKQAVRARAFRDDLYYRLAVVTIELPRLGDRREDLAQLADEFLRQFAARCGRTGVRLSSRALEALSSYDFPGNVRELRNIIEHAVVTSSEDEIGLAGLPEYLRSAARLMQSRTTKPSLAELEAVYISEVLEHTRGNKTRAAEILGISRKNLYEKMRRYNIGKLGAASPALN
jgi:transcriptional regulator with PAS, ATPase and Fis domain